MLRDHRVRPFASWGMMTGVTALIGIGSAWLAIPAHAQQASAPAPMVQAATLTAEQASELRAEASALPTASAPKGTLDWKNASSSDAGASAAKSLTLTVPSLLKPNEKCGQLPPVGVISPFPINIRLGAMISPNVKFDGGIDVTFSGFHLMPGLTTRIDADAIVSANFGGVSTLVPITVDQVFSKSLIAGSRIYLGAGVGPYIGDTTRFGGKAFVGAGLSSRLTAEVDVHFPGFGDPLVTVQTRFGL
ncbi:MAG TPA: hypothetical protein VKU00_20255 [Chthonomonadaceae bacterium]|nr:hypothetical protein [Chthonomonadaceae bacterium]